MTKVLMLVGISQSDGFKAAIGEELELEDALAREMIADGRAQSAGAAGRSSGDASLSADSPKPISKTRVPKPEVNDGDR